MEYKTERIVVRVTPTEKRYIENKCARKGWTISYVVRKFLKEWFKK